MPGSQHFFFTSFICMALFGAARAIKKSLFWVEKLTPLRRGESPAACRGGGGPLIRNAQQYLNFATFGSHFPTFTQGKCQAAHQMSGMSDILQYIAFFSFPFFFVPFFFFPFFFFCVSGWILLAPPLPHTLLKEKLKGSKQKKS